MADVQRRVNADQALQLNNGADIVAIQELLGHSKIEMTMRYSKLSSLKARTDYYQAMEKIAPSESGLPTVEVPPTKNWFLVGVPQRKILIKELVKVKTITCNILI